MTTPKEASPGLFFFAAMTSEVAGKPVSQWALEDLRDAGARDVAVVLGSLAPERVVEYYGDGSRLGLRLTYVYQGYPYGIAHAVYTVRDFVGDEPFVVYLGDNVILEGIARFARDFEGGDYDAYVLFAEVPDPTRFGVGVFDERGNLRGFVEKPRAPPSPYALVGVYFFRPPHVFRAIETLRPSWRGELEITEALQRLLDWGLRVGYGFVKGWWKDTGTPEDVLEANRMLLDYKLEPVSRGTVEGSVIEGRVRIEEGVTVRNSVIRGPSVICRGSAVEDSYVGPYTSVGEECVLEGVEVENSVLMDRVELRGLEARITDSIIGSDTKVWGSGRKPRGVRLVVGEKSKIEL